MAARSHPAPRTLFGALLAALLALGAGTSAASPAPWAPAPHVPAPHAPAAPGPVPLATGDGTWRWPVDPPRSIARPFIPPPTPYAAGHRGIDIRAPAGTLYAPAAGVVHFAGVVVDRPVLSIDHGGGVLSSYEPVTTALVEGDAVARGDVIGTVLPGHCASVCVHLGVRVDGQYVSPLRFLGGIPRAILLPTRALEL
jgi:murein DD-endopeptidase MepM/ murein hydrolase activator NlpD